MNFNFIKSDFSDSTLKYEGGILFPGLEFNPSGLVDWVISSGRNVLVDTNSNSKLLKEYEPFIFVETGVDREKGGYWGEILDQGHILPETHSRRSFRENSEVLTLSAFDSFGGPEASVFYRSNSETVYCGHCASPTVVTLTNGKSDAIYVCQGLTVVDFSQLVRAIAFPEIFALCTDDGCLGWSSAQTNSFSLEKEKNDFWKNLYDVQR